MLSLAIDIKPKPHRPARTGVATNFEISHQCPSAYFYYKNDDEDKVLDPAYPPTDMGNLEICVTVDTDSPGIRSCTAGPWGREDDAALLSSMGKRKHEVCEADRGIHHLHFLEPLISCIRSLFDR
jgi:hypothetical protein